MKYLVLAAIVLAFLSMLNVQQAGPPLGLVLVLLLVVGFFAGCRRTGRALFGFHRKMRRNGLW